MNCTTQIEGAKGILRLEGRFTFEAGADFKTQAKALLDEVSELHLDFGSVSHMESSALGVLLLLREQMPLELRNGPEHSIFIIYPCHHLLHLLNLALIVFPAFPTEMTPSLCHSHFLSCG